jgi:alpha-ribazole phosphatase CobZ
MKLSSIDAKGKEDQPEEITQKATRDIRDILKEKGISEEVLVSTAMELYVPHPGVRTRDIAEEVFKKELALALSDPNLCILIYSAILLEEEGKKGRLPGIASETYDKDLTCLIVDEVIGMSIAKYISGDKGIFEYVRFDKLKPGILSELGPFLDDVVAGLIGGVSANMYTRASGDVETGKKKIDLPQGGVAG